MCRLPGRRAQLSDAWIIFLPPSVRLRCVSVVRKVLCDKVLDFSARSCGLERRFWQSSNGVSFSDLELENFFLGVPDHVVQV